MSKGKKVSRTIKVKNNTANKKAREKYLSHTSISHEGDGRAPVAKETPLPQVFEGVEEAYKASPEPEGMFTECPVCKNEKLHKDRAVEASKKAEMIMVIRDIISRFRTAANAKFDALSADIQAQLKPIVEASNKIAITRSELSESLSDLEDNLRAGFGITDEIDPEIMSGAIFAETVDGDPFNPPEPGTDPVFDTITTGVDTALSENDSTDQEITFSQDRPLERPEAPLGSVSKPRKEEDRTKWN
jgi:hypothetical protein